MKLYFHPMSGNSRRARLVIDHLKVPCEQVLIDLTKGEQKQPAHLARNPNGRVPVLEVEPIGNAAGGAPVELWESRAIMQYLCDISPSQDLMPTEALAKADVNRWLSWDAMDMAPALTILVYENVVKGFGGQQPDPAQVERGLGMFAKAAGVLNAHLAGKKWIAQDKLTLADYSIASGFALAVPAKMPMADYPHLVAWLNGVKELDAWKKTSPPGIG